MIQIDISNRDDEKAKKIMQLAKELGVPFVFGSESAINVSTDIWEGIDMMNLTDIQKKAVENMISRNKFMDFVMFTSDYFVNQSGKYEYAMDIMTEMVAEFLSEDLQGLLEDYNEKKKTLVSPTEVEPVDLSKQKWLAVYRVEVVQVEALTTFLYEEKDANKLDYGSCDWSDPFDAEAVIGVFEGSYADVLKQASDFAETPARHIKLYKLDGDDNGSRS